MNLTAHFTFLAFKILKLWLSYVNVMLASYKLEISQTMPSWGKLSTGPALGFSGPLGGVEKRAPKT
jgi:hypothetical protein